MRKAPASREHRPRRALTLVLWLAAMAIGALFIARTPFSADLSAFLPAHPDARQRLLIEQLQGGVASRSLLVGLEGGADAAQRAEVSRAMANRLRDSGLFDLVQNGEHSDWTEAGEWLLAHRYQLAPGVDPAHFSVAGLRDAVLDTLSLLGTPAGNLVKPLLERDPTGEMQRIAEGLIPASAPRSEGGVWVSRTAPRALLLVTTRAAGSDLDAQAVAIEAVRTAFDEATKQAGATRPTLQISGAPLFSVQSRDQIKAEAVKLATIGALVVGGLLLLAFASPRALLVAVVPVATGVVGGTAAVGLAFGHVHGLTMGFGSTLIGETIDYAIYYLIQARRGATDGAPGSGWRQWVRVHWPTVRLGVLTSVCGFSALVFSGFPGLAQLGVFSVAGLVTAALATRYVLPVFTPDGASGRGLRHHMAQMANGLMQALPRLRWLLLALCLASAALLAWQHDHIWRAGLGSMSPVPLAAQELDEKLRADLGADEASTLVMVQGDDLESTLQSVEAASARLQPLVDAGQLAGFDAVTRVLPSRAAQQARQASVPDAQTLRERLQQALQGLPLSASRLEPFIEEASAARTLAPIGLADLRNGSLAPLVNAMLVERPGSGYSAVVSLHPGATFDPAALRQALAGLPQVQVIDVGVELHALYARYLSEAFVQVLLGALGVVVLLGLYLRSLRRLLAVCRPLVGAVLLTLGAQAVLGVPLGILHLVGLLLVVAVGSNYALFFDQLRETGRADEDTLASLLLANLTTVVSFGLIALSEIPSLSAIGRVVAPGALLALLLSAAFARGQVRPSA
ncbi:MMPL family transporter [Variovorax sp.]|uniref:MMPL family transporter n=1 Tax=Variovorax sp. TaxID=1871043 RepID=UPI002D405B4D|nr:MMPL family transporter [Variovorax sp.]HYP86246.1 MMPL family transporter [Variovorax sp.]